MPKKSLKALVESAVTRERARQWRRENRKLVALMAAQLPHTAMPTCTGDPAAKEQERRSKAADPALRVKVALEILSKVDEYYI